MEIEMVRRMLPSSPCAALGKLGVCRRRDAAQRLLRPDPRALRGFQRGLRSAYQKETGKSVEIKQSHGGSGTQARAVIDGLQADVVTLALAYDIDAIAAKGLIAADWQKRLPHNSLALHLDHRVPGAQGQSQGHQGLGRPGQARRRGHHAEPEDLGRRALELSRRLGLRAEANPARPSKAQALRRPSSTSNVPVLDTGARGSTTTFVRARHRRRAAGLGERGVPRAQREFGTDKFEIVSPSLSILAEPPVAVVDAVVDRKGTRAVAEAYLKYWYSQGRPGDCRAQLLSSARSRDRHGIRQPVREARTCSRSTTCSAAGPRRRRNTSAKAASSTRSTRTDSRGEQGAL